MSVFVRRDPVLIRLFELSVYVDGIRAEAAETLYEQPSVTGSAVLSNRCRKGSRIVFSGRCYDESAPMKFIATLNNMTGTYSGFTINYRGLVMTGCRLIGYTADDSGEDYLNVTFTVYTSDTMDIEEVSGE